MDKRAANNSDTYENERTSKVGGSESLQTIHKS